MDNYLLILRGISGAGKTTFVNHLKSCIDLVHASADFIHVDPNGVYRFDPAKLGEGHGLCFRTTILALQERAQCVVVDNTHCSNWELAPYVLAGQAYQYKTAIVRMEIDPATAAKRNVHGVPEKNVCSMAHRFQEPLNFWPREYRFTNPTQKEVLDFYSEFTR